jgi:hypothetical protein
MIQIKTGQTSTRKESNFLHRNQKVSARRSLNRISRNRWLTKITNTCTTVHRERMPDKLVYRTIILNKYILSKENKNAYWMIIWSIRQRVRFMEVMKTSWGGKRLPWLISMGKPMKIISTVLTEKYSAKTNLTKTPNITTQSPQKWRVILSNQQLKSEQI